jgi:RNA polymerase sigma-70 factor (ECF subfamily)
MTDEEQIRTLIEAWAFAVHDGDLDTVLAGCRLDAPVPRPPSRAAAFKSASEPFTPGIGVDSPSQGRASTRTWLYRIAANACLETLRRNTRRVAPAPAGLSADSGPSVAGMPWLQPYPDSLLDELAVDQPGPEELVVNRETMSLAFLATIQLLPPRQRAVLILRDVSNWSAAEAAAMLDTTVPAVNSALQRARATVRRQWPGGRLEWAPVTQSDPEQRRLLQAFITADEQADPEALIAMLRHDIRLAISPQVGEWRGRQDVAAALRSGMNSLGQWRLLPITANGQLGSSGSSSRGGRRLSRRRAGRCAQSFTANLAALRRRWSLCRVRRSTRRGVGPGWRGRCWLSGRSEGRRGRRG